MRVLSIFSIFIISINLNAQSYKITDDMDPRGMIFIPPGKIPAKVYENNDTTTENIEIKAIWMSNEITNKEYFEFVNYAIQHPNEEICWTETMYATEIKNCKKYSEISKDLIDSNVWKNAFVQNDTMQTLYNDYFTNKTFLKYPIVGVSYQNAKIYCAWRTKIDNKKLNGSREIPDYRLPYAFEWKYVADQEKSKRFYKDANMLKSKTGKKYHNGIDLVKCWSGSTNFFGLSHFEDNVSELMENVFTSKDSTQKVQYMGGNWHDGSTVNTLKYMDKNLKTNYIGFRIVRLYGWKKK